MLRQGFFSSSYFFWLCNLLAGLVQCENIVWNDQTQLVLRSRLFGLSWKYIALTVWLVEVEILGITVIVSKAYLRVGFGDLVKSM